MQNLRIGLAQINCTVGGLSGNLAKISDFIQKAEKAGVDLLCFPELAITGYPPEDLLLKPSFIEDNRKALEELTRRVNNLLVVVGFVDRVRGKLYNAAAVIYERKVHAVYHKMKLPNYGVFDEKRYFEPGDRPLVFRFGPARIGLSICEDIWHKEGPIKQEAQAGAQLAVNINASPYHLGKIKEREGAIQRQARANRLAVAYVNLVGGQDELLFDGQSMFVDSRGTVIVRAGAFKEELLLVDSVLPDRARPGKKTISVAREIPSKNKIWVPLRLAGHLDTAQEVYEALLAGLRDYVNKNGFQKVVIGLSGGIDSALVAALAADALGKDNVTAVYMPSRYSSRQSEEDAHKVAENLGVKILTIPIEQLYKVFLMVLEPRFEGTQKNIAEENLQARIRGTILMALSNKFGWLVLATGNKSEMSTGYATLYGDMAGGFAVLKDVPKTLVYKVARYRNSLAAVIPESVLSREPTAELRPNQRDTDTLPAYETLDPILAAYVEEDRGFEEVVSLGFEPETVRRVFGLVDKSEYKRRQAPPGVKITPRAFGKDRRMPITNKYRGCDEI